MDPGAHIKNFNILYIYMGSLLPENLQVKFGREREVAFSQYRCHF